MAPCRRVGARQLQVDARAGGAVDEQLAQGGDRPAHRARHRREQPAAAGDDSTPPAPSPPPSQARFHLPPSTCSYGTPPPLPRAIVTTTDGGGGAVGRALRPPPLPRRHALRPLRLPRPRLAHLRCAEQRTCARTPVASWETISTPTRPAVPPPFVAAVAALRLPTLLAILYQRTPHPHPSLLSLPLRMEGTYMKSRFMLIGTPSGITRAPMPKARTRPVVRQLSHSPIRQSVRLPWAWFCLCEGLPESDLAKKVSAALLLRFPHTGWRPRAGRTSPSARRSSAPPCQTCSRTHRTAPQTHDHASARRHDAWKAHATATARACRYEPAFADEVKATMRAGFAHMNDPTDDGGAVYLRLSTRALPQVRLRRPTSLGRRLPCVWEGGESPCVGDGVEAARVVQTREGEKGESRERERALAITEALLTDSRRAARAPPRAADLARPADRRCAARRNRQGRLLARAAHRLDARRHRLRRRRRARGSRGAADPRRRGVRAAPGAAPHARTSRVTAPPAPFSRPKSSRCDPPSKVPVPWRQPPLSPLHCVPRNEAP